MRSASRAASSLLQLHKLPAAARRFHDTLCTAIFKAETRDRIRASQRTGLERSDSIMSELFSRLVLLVSLLLSFAPTSRAGEASEQASENQEVFPVRGYAPNRSAVESLFVAVDPGQDGWTAEVVSEAIAERLHALEEALRDRDPGPIAPLVHSDFQGASLEPVSSQTVAAPSGVRLFRYRYNDELSIGAGQAPSALLAWVQEFHSFSVLEFKIVSIQVGAHSDVEPSEAWTRILYDLSGRGAGNDILARRGWWRVNWVASGDGWKMNRLEIEPGTEGRTAKPFFTDVSTVAWANAPSYREQMWVGIDHFRTRMDAASGIDLYGHSGLAVGDVDGDGLEDLFVAQPQGLPNRLYRNRVDGTFEDISRQAGVDLLERTSMGLFGDVDNDGDQDLFVVIQNWTVVLLLNDGQGRFALSRASFERKVGVKATLSSASLADYDNDGDLDLYVTCYRYFGAPGEDTALALPYPYHDATNGPPNILFRNRGDGTFEDVTTSTGLDGGNDRFSFSSSWGDFNNDGWLDLYVANDFGRNNLYQNLGDGRFVEVSRKAGVEDIGSGMSVAWADYDLDGKDDLYVGNMWSSAGLRLTGQPGYQTDEARASYVRHAKGNSLFRNLGGNRFEDVGDEAGVEFGRWAWSSDFLDCDNDGDDDLYSVNGYISNTSTKDL